MQLTFVTAEIQLLEQKHLGSETTGSFKILPMQSEPQRHWVIHNFMWECLWGGSCEYLLDKQLSLSKNRIFY